MALDAALMEGSDQSGFEPFFRLYQWDPACLSLGRFQNPTTGLAPHAGGKWPIVRRMTGGGAILHQHELTYSLGFRLEDWPTTLGVLSYEHLCQFLLETWRSLGWTAVFAKDVPSNTQPLGLVSPACFAGQEKHDILVDGKKLGGNAQRRDRGWIFQHGSIPLEIDWGALEAVFDEGYRPDPAKTTDVRSLGYRGTPNQLAELLTVHAQAQFGVEFEHREVTADLDQRVRQWEKRQFLDERWTLGESTTVRT